ncbi:MAG: fimbrial protein [Fibrobacter sp.]|nr:fimbrial protein [Fibrobacter sp.]
MKNAFSSILLLTVAGLAVLIAGSLYFGAPLFGWVIMAAIFVVFVVEQVLALKKLKQISAETEILETCESRGNYNVSGEGVVAKRIKLANSLIAKKIRLDSPIAFEVLNSNVQISVPRSAGGSVILLGLMGTFFGLMYSVATAGGAIDNSTTQGTLDTIQLLFQGMKGIFGTSLCGLFAALILNASRALLLGARDTFMARLDTMTLNLQGNSENEVEQSKNELERLFESVEKNLAQVTSSVQSSLSGIVTKVGEELTAATTKMNQNVSSSVEQVSANVNASVQKVSTEMSASVKSLNESLASAMSGMNDAVKDLGSSVSASISTAFAPMENSVKALSASVESIPSKLDDKLNGLSSALDNGLGDIASGVKAGLNSVADDVKSALNDVSGSVYDGLYKVSESAQNSLADSSTSIAESIADQVKQSNEQWNEFMQRLEERATANVDAQKDGLETLKNVALQVAEKAQAGSAELSQSVSEKLAALSNDILSAFQKLSETSATLLDAQKALTESIDNRVVKEKEASDALGGNIVETAELMRVNQSELSANLEMLRAGLETILEKLSGDTAERDEEENFIEHLNQSLEAFHERASEVLMENAVKTQEILLEVLEQTQRSNSYSAPAPAASAAEPAADNGADKIEG